jgi:sigma-B regulation protein RsbU (phosphoserine phosphatase)
VESLPVGKFFAIIGVHLSFAFLLRQRLLKSWIQSSPLQNQSTSLFFLDYALFVGAGVGVGLFNTLAFGFPLFSGLKVVVGFAAVGLIPAIDLSLDWEYRIIRQAKNLDPAHTAPQSYYPQTRKFAIIACGIIIFVTFILILILWRDFLWLMNQSQSEVSLPEMLHVVIWEVLFVMGTMLGLTVVAVFSYARNLKLLFSNQTAVLELVSQGLLEQKVPVVTNDEFAIIAGYTNVMIDRLVERERMSRGLDLARQIQVNLLPRSSPLLAGVQVFGSSLFCDETGGDFYDFLVRDGEDGPELVIMVGDVTGHGVGSALLMTSVRAYLRAHLGHIVDLAEVMNRTNALICGDVAGSGLFVTGFLFSFSPSRRQARWTSAGHDPAIFHTYGLNDCVELRGEDIPLGVDPQWNYILHSERLEPGVLMLGTDGVWEAMNADNTMFGKVRLQQVLHESLYSTPQEITSRIFAEVEAFTGTDRLEDDRTVVIARLAYR